MSARAFLVTISFLALAAGSAWAGASPANVPVPPKSHDSFGDMDCGNCHTTAGWKLGPDTSGATTSEGGFDHAKTGFPLRSEHAHVTCLGCHVPGRPITRECSGCHADSHEGRLGARCDECHRPTDWKDTRVMEAHRKTRLPLSGMHAMIDCTACHLRNGERAYGDTPSDCYSCHSAEYQSNVTHPSHLGDPAKGQRPFPRDCTVCHTTVSWTPAFLPAQFMASPVASAASLDEHERFFPIRTGRHRGFACASCHPAGVSSPGAAAAIDCTGCHEHSTFRLAQVHRRAVPLDGTACVRCHPAGVSR